MQVIEAYREGATAVASPHPEIPEHGRTEFADEESVIDFRFAIFRETSCPVSIVALSSATRQSIVRPNHDPSFESGGFLAPSKPLAVQIRNIRPHSSGSHHHVFTLPESEVFDYSFFYLL